MNWNNLKSFVEKEGNTYVDLTTHIDLLLGEAIEIIKEKHELEKWQTAIIYNLLKYNFISIKQIDKAAKVIKQYSSENELFNECPKTDDWFNSLIESASQA